MDNATLTAKMNDILLAERPELVKLKRLFPKGRDLLRALRNVTD